jgi:hypothetical protein
MIRITLTIKHILPIDTSISSAQDLLVNTLTLVSEHSRPPLPLLTNLNLHTATDGLADAKFATQHGHLERILGGAPVAEAGFQRV